MLSCDVFSLIGAAFRKQLDDTKTYPSVVVGFDIADHKSYRNFVSTLDVADTTDSSATRTDVRADADTAASAMFTAESSRSTA